MGCKQGLNLTPLIYKMFALPVRLLSYTLNIMYFFFHIQIIEETTIENRVHKTMVLCPWIVHVISKIVSMKRAIKILRELM